MQFSASDSHSYHPTQLHQPIDSYQSQSARTTPSQDRIQHILCQSLIRTALESVFRVPYKQGDT